MYTLSAQLIYGSLLLFRGLDISMSVNIDERPTFEEKKELFTLIEVCLSSSYIHFEGRILNLIISVNGHCISVR